VTLTYTSDSSEKIATDLAAEIDRLPNDAHGTIVRANMSDTTAPQAIVEATLKAFGGHIDILVNNAAVQVTRALVDVTIEDINAVFDSNVRGIILLTQAVLPHLRAPGRIINISSVGARAGFAALSLYAGSKGCLEAMSRSWARELGKDGTTVNVVAPGPVQSEMLETIPKDIVAAQKRDTAVEARIGTPDEVANVVCWLASNDASWVSGQVINVSGGWSMY
jgi:3-oxoacyl-[acyl-carrier protein] reductase